MILQRTAEFFHAASALSCRSGLDNDMRLKCRDGSEGGRHHHRLTSYDQPARLDIIGITCRHPRPTGSSPCVDSSEIGVSQRPSKMEARASGRVIRTVWLLLPAGLL